MSETPLDRLWAEVGEQPEVVARLIARPQPSLEALVVEIRRRRPRAVVLVARGSSDHAAVYGRYLFETRNRLLTSLAAPSTVTLYGSGPDLADALVIGVSQSGRGEDVVSYLRAARSQGAATAAIVNDPESPLAKTAEWVLDCAAGPEISVPATKTVTAEMTLLAMLSTAIDGASLEGLPEAVEATLRARPAAAKLARGVADAESVSVIGRGYAYPAALEIALKMKETSYTLAEPFSAADFLHGPLALVEPGRAGLLVDVGGHSSRPARETAEAIARNGGTPLSLRVGRVETAAGSGFAVPVELDEPWCAIPAVVAGQLLALELAAALGIDPAVPRAIKKVTSTR